ncbi:hypothetical protein H4R33_003814 [Dimargaris cristalligena]|uniref:Uncharacterized protein n=1 Tax=Dimargaris cristalligena TaxID=215637 RepID=A0A4P9ZKI7_9FUNG|nr:hypothetical protein H4R33_003814 [Dimargaris cristalligena]RKP33603.1 hypothetical protein BJ085DRAFT_39984 [Dimargaris cristalligena]|eukprot:RKP33603.1 hypothetical protein BJ085DRAFT_39984 [Dimargaris cristalligena]
MTRNSSNTSYHVERTDDFHNVISQIQSISIGNMTNPNGRYTNTDDHDSSRNDPDSESRNGFDREPNDGPNRESSDDSERNIKLFLLAAVDENHYIDFFHKAP